MHAQSAWLPNHCPDQECQRALRYTAQPSNYMLDAPYADLAAEKASNSQERLAVLSC